MKKLSFLKLRITNVQRCEAVFHKLNDWVPRDWALAMIGEAGEACNEVKKLKRGDGDIDRIAMELADVVIYADLLAARLGINLGESVVKKFNLVSDKKGTDIKL